MRNENMAKIDRMSQFMEKGNVACRSTCTIILEMPEEIAILRPKKT